MSTNQSQLLVYLGLALAVAGFTGVLTLRDPLLFRKYFGALNPLLVVAATAVLGGALLWILLSRGWFAVYRAGNPGRLLVPSGVALLLAGGIILVDRAVLFPEDINVLFPDSLLFYPVMGFVAEVVFHLLPLTALLVGLTTLGLRYESILWPCLVAVALADPIFQTVAGSAGDAPLWVTEYVFLHVFAINLLEVVLFRRFDFVTMYAFRLVYYALWHVVWGYLRLRLLF